MCLYIHVKDAMLSLSLMVVIYVNVSMIIIKFYHCITSRLLHMISLEGEEATSSHHLTRVKFFTYYSTAESVVHTSAYAVKILHLYIHPIMFISLLR